MKSLKYIIIAAFTALLCSSCLDSNMKELDVYDGAEISSALVYYRYIDNSFTFPLSGAHAVKQANLTVADKTIDETACTATFNVTVPSNFPESELGNLSASKLVVALNISTAAIIAPESGSPALGTPADWSTPHKYTVTSAKGTKKSWTVTVNLNKNI